MEFDAARRYFFHIFAITVFNVFHQLRGKIYYSTKLWNCFFKKPELSNKFFLEWIIPTEYFLEPLVVWAPRGFRPPSGFKPFGLLDLYFSTKSIAIKRKTSSLMSKRPLILSSNWLSYIYSNGTKGFTLLSSHSA